MRINPAEIARQGGIDGFTIGFLGHGPTTQRRKTHVVAAAGDATREAVDHRHFLFPRCQRLHGQAQLMALQGTILQPGRVPGHLNPLRLDVAGVHAIALHEEQHPRGPGLHSARQLIEELSQEQAARSNRTSFEEVTAFNIHINHSSSLPIVSLKKSPRKAKIL